MNDDKKVSPLVRVKCSCGAEYRTTPPLLCPDCEHFCDVPKCALNVQKIVIQEGAVKP